MQNQKDNVVKIGHNSEKKTLNEEMFPFYIKTLWKIYFHIRNLKHNFERSHGKEVYDRKVGKHRKPNKLEIAKATAVVMDTLTYMFDDLSEDFGYGTKVKAFKDYLVENEQLTPLHYRSVDIDEFDPERIDFGQYPKDL